MRGPLHSEPESHLDPRGPGPPGQQRPPPARISFQGKGQSSRMSTAGPLLSIPPWPVLDGQHHCPVGAPHPSVKRAAPLLRLLPTCHIPRHITRTLSTYTLTHTRPSSEGFVDTSHQTGVQFAKENVRWPHCSEPVRLRRLERTNFVRESQTGDGEGEGGARF